MPDLPLSFALHLHHWVVSFLDVIQSHFNLWKQVNDLLLTAQELAVIESKHKVTFQLVWQYVLAKPKASPWDSRRIQWEHICDSCKYKTCKTGGSLGLLQVKIQKRRQKTLPTIQALLIWNAKIDPDDNGEHSNSTMGLYSSSVAYIGLYGLTTP